MIESIPGFKVQMQKEIDFFFPIVRIVMVCGIAGLLRCGKSCRLRWTNYLRPDLKRGLLSNYEEKLVIDLHAQLGNRLVTISLSLLSLSISKIIMFD